MGSVKTDLQTEMNSVKIDLQAEMGSVKTDLAEFRAETNRRFDGLENKIDNIEANNADRHVSINGDLRNIKTTHVSIPLLYVSSFLFPPC